jgi:hypothetical protein
MLPAEFGFIFLYVAAFGFSDYFVKITKLTGFRYLLYYIAIGILGFVILFKCDYFLKNNVD